MRDFCEPAAVKHREELSRAIHGAGVFRHFKSALRHQGMEQAWFDFRLNARREIARDWCEENTIDCE